MPKQPDRFSQLISMLFRAHPWHGVKPETDDPAIFNVFSEIVQEDGVKFELDKATGLLKVDRPQLSSSTPPCLYGYVPQTYCGDRTAELCKKRTGRRKIVGDGDPLDICIISDKKFARGDILMKAKVIGGLRMIDKGEADDKILAVLVNDTSYGLYDDIEDCPKGKLTQILHYFESYKNLPEVPTSFPSVPKRRKPTVEITHVYDCAEALEVIQRSREDYDEKFGNHDARMEELRDLAALIVAGKA